MFSSENRLNQDTFSEREEFSLRHQQVIVSNEIFIIFSYPANVAKSLLDGNRDHLPAEARSELTKQGHKVEFLNICIGEFQQHIYVQRLELEGAHLGYAESRREQVGRSCRKLNAFSHRRSPFRFFVLSLRPNWDDIWRRLLETTFGDHIWRPHLETTFGDGIRKRHLETTLGDHMWRPYFETMFGDQIETNMRPRCETLLICEFIKRAHRFGKRQFQSATKFVGGVLQWHWQRNLFARAVYGTSRSQWRWHASG